LCYLWQFKEGFDWWSRGHCRTIRHDHGTHHAVQALELQLLPTAKL
jgi:hypothetical protein